MPSPTQHTEQTRQRKHTKAGRKKKKARARAGTPKFPIHPEKARQQKSAPKSSA
jgi:hypothetical protein